MLWAGVAFVYLKGLPRPLTVGADGVTLAWFGGAQFIPAAGLRGASVTYREGRDGRPVYDGFFLHTPDGSTRLMVFGGLFWSGSRALKGRLDEAAAVTLTAMDLEPSLTHVRVAAAANSVADPDLRDVFEGLARDNDERVVDAMRRLHWR